MEGIVEGNGITESKTTSRCFIDFFTPKSHAQISSKKYREINDSDVITQVIIL